MAAGQGFKSFLTGDVLTASDVNGYLMQGIWVFASTAARDAAVTAPSEGNFAFTKDTNSLWYYDGAAWVASGATGDIEGVTAGIGISGGGTSGTVTVTNSMATAIDAKGDLIVGTGADTFSKLTAGTNGYLLTADSAEATGLKWAAAAGGGGGKVLQVVAATTSSLADVLSTTFTDTNLTASITPTLATSKVLVLVSQNMGVYRVTSVAAAAMRLQRGATTVYDCSGTNNNSAMKIGATGASEVYMSGNFAISFLDSPATTSSTTYKTQGRCQTTANSASLSFQDGGTSSIILLEIGA